MITADRTRKNLFTPLRYPGGKTSLANYFARLMDANVLVNPRYVEPFAGGAGAALSLLLTERVSSIVINDLDPAIAAFWRAVVRNTDRFIESLVATPVSVDEWRKQKAIYLDDSSDDFSRGFATFFLNRTNRSGILRAGPIGGYNQEGNWKIDARFDRRALAARISLIGRYRSRIVLREEDGRDVLREFSSGDSTFLYVDPPYYVQGAELYLNAYAADDHTVLAEELRAIRSSNWVLTYDNVGRIRELYDDFEQQEFALQYSAHAARVAKEVMIFSDSVRPV